MVELSNAETAPTPQSPFTQRPNVGIGFQALIRTQFTLAKQLGGSGGDITLNMGWLYDQFQNRNRSAFSGQLCAVSVGD